MKILFYLILSLVLLPFSSHSQSEANLLGQWSDDSIVGSEAYDNNYNEIWGVARNGHEYAVIGSTDGTHFINVDDPENPFEAFFVEGAFTGVNVVHRDFHDYKCYLYIACGETGGANRSTLQIVDLSDLPNSIDVVYDSMDAFEKSHNIFIDTAQAVLYGLAISGGVSASNNALRVYDISDPVNPTFIDKYFVFGGLVAGHVHDAYVRDGIAYLNCGNDGFAIVDFTDPTDPVTLGTLTDYPDAGYNHSGWLTDDGNYYYMADENHGASIKILDVSNPAEIEVVGTFDAESESATSITHNQLINCNTLYTSYYYDGLQVFDITDPTNPIRSYYYETSNEPDADSYKGAWGVYPYLPSGILLLSDMQEGLFVFDSMDDNCTGLSMDDYCVPATAVSEIPNLSSITTFPNPVGNQLIVQLELKKNIVDLGSSLVDVTGRTVQDFGKFDVQKGAVQLDFQLNDAITNGFYFLKLADGENTKMKKIIVQR